MRTIICKKLGTVSSITVGKSYDIIEENDTRFTIVNDNGIQMRYGKNLFNDPIEVVDEPVVGNQPQRRSPGRPRNAANAQNAAPIPAPARPIPVIDAIEVETEADNVNGQVMFMTKFKFMDNFEWRRSSLRIINTSGISASCGIQSIDGLNSLIEEIEIVRNGFLEYVRNNAQNFRLGAGIDMEDLFNQVSAAYIQDLVASYQGDDADIRAGILILSTTMNTIERAPSMRRALDGAAINQIPVHNPNSGNDIVMWNIAVEA